MKWRCSRFLLAAPLLLAAFAMARADTQTEQAFRAMGLKVGDVLTGTVLSARVLPGEAKQVVAVTTFFTGKRDKANAVSVRLSVFRQEKGELVPTYTRDFGEENGGYVAQGDLQLVDLDLDGINEIVVTYDDLESPVIERRTGEIIVHEESGFRTAWTGAVKYDATRAARQVPLERRDRYQRELDLESTLRTRGVTLFFKKTVVAVAGERLPQPKIVQETFPLRPPPEGW